MRKFIILAAALVALIVPTAAIASVAVDANGVGFVGKGDVQTALGGIDDAAMQKLFEDKQVKFTTGYNKVEDVTINCIKMTFTPGSPPSIVNTGETVHWIYSTPVTQDAKVTANTNKAGKLTNGWNLTGFDGPATDGTATKVSAPNCPSGSLNGQASPDRETTFSPRSGLQVTANGIGTFDLPNTPVL